MKNDPCKRISGIVPIYDVVCLINRPKKDELDVLEQEWVDLDSVPEELEAELFIPGRTDWERTIIRE